MAYVVYKRKRFRQISIQAERFRGSARDLRYFECVSQPIAKMIRITSGKNLRLGFQTAKRAGVNDAVAVPCIFSTVGVRGLRKTASEGLSFPHCPRDKRRVTFDGCSCRLKNDSSA